MIFFLAITVGVLFACGIYLMMQRTIVKLLIGIALLSNAANLVFFTSAGLRRGVPPLIAEGEKMPPAGHADPLAQALILTAIVIGFGMLAFSAALAHRTYQSTQTDNLDDLTQTDR